MIGRLKFDLSQLANEILDQVPTKVWTSSTTRFLDPCMGGGQFVVEIERRLLKAGHSVENVATRVFGCETNILRVQYARNRLGLVGQYEVCDALARDWGSMKFDVVIGNPPYQDGLWKDFVVLACKLSNHHVCMVSPDSITQYSASKKADNFKTILVDNGIQSVTDATHHFPDIRSGAISVFALDVTKIANESAFVKTGIQHDIVRKVLSQNKDGVLHAILATQKATYSAYDRSDCEKDGYTKILDSVNTNGVVVVAWLEKYTNKVVDGNHYYFANRFFGQSQNFAIAEFAEEITLGQNTIAIQKIPNMSLETFRRIYGSKLFRFVLSVIKNGKFDTPVAAINTLPIVREENLYVHFNLTPEEIAYVESTVN